MNLSWQAYLQSHSAVIQDGCAVSYGNNAAELESVRSATVLADLSHFGLIHFSGEDAQSFLQGQLSCDIRETNTAATDSTALYGSYCNPKGRMLASFLVWPLMWHGDSGYVVQLPGGLRAAIQKRLSMFVLRAKVKLSDKSDALVRIGVAGGHADASVRKILGTVPVSHLGVIHSQLGSVIRLAQDRFEFVIAPEHAPTVWERLSEDAVPVGAACWDWLEIKAGIPVITAATQEQFVPQMVNLDAIGGVSFHKGCYPGQEIVARTEYLGKIKRRMVLANIGPHASGAISPLPVPVTAGDELFSTDMGEQSSGMIVNAAPAPEGGFDALAVVQTSSIEAGKIYWKSLDGPPLAIMPLPYPVNS
ncbi:MAG: folate-binding protein YgfZ [Pseudomonadota bacterium]|nr:folate-binding protein YgfZ [Pseudomonadota bacterium]